MSALLPAQSRPRAAHVPQDVRTKGGVKPQGMACLTGNSWGDPPYPKAQGKQVHTGLAQCLQACKCAPCPTLLDTRH